MNGFIGPGAGHDKEIQKLITFVAGTAVWNLFKLTGVVRISDINAHVETVVPAVACTVYLQMFSAGGSVDISKAPGVDISGIVEGAFLVRNGPSTIDLDLANPNAVPAVAENIAWREPRTAIDIVEDDANDTYVRLVMSVPQASGAMHWHCKWEALSENGFLTPAP